MDRGPRRWFDGPGCATIDRVTSPSTAHSPATPATTPVSIDAVREARTLTIAWTDGHRTTYDFTALRWLCPCAHCRGEAGMPGWLDSGPTLTAEQTSLTDLHLVGNYAVSPHWADGHRTGYYPFVLLRDRCPCPECSARRASGGVPSEPPPVGTHEEHR